MRKETFKDLHKRLLKNGLTYKSSGYGGGLCNVTFNNEELEYRDDFNLFKPGYRQCNASYWAYDGKTERYNECLAGQPHPRRWEYTPLRQNIVLFLAAMNGEL